MRQPDIEIYLKDVDQDAVTHWLGRALGTATPWQAHGQTQKAAFGGIPVTWLPKAVGRWHCLLVDSDRTDWEDDLQCARAAHQALGVQVRCSPGSWQEGDSEEDADRWIRVDADGVEEIVWRTD